MNYYSNINLFVYLSKRYIQEFFEALLILLLYKFLIVQKVDVPILLNISWIAMVIGFITLLLEEWAPSYGKNVKNGMLAYIGTNVIKNKI
ncbi:MAG TPA: hypothetical protein V6C58_12200 [Allocoleopsis sp.]